MGSGRIDGGNVKGTTSSSQNPGLTGVGFDRSGDMAQMSGVCTWWEDGWIEKFFV